MSKMAALKGSNIIDSVDTQILECLNLNEPRSFFLFAGAGSGKTRSLVNVLKKFKERYGETLKLRGKRVAIITYTNAACDEIKSRLDYDALFVVSTIHSFVWELIKRFNDDIREWLRADIGAAIEELEEKHLKGRAGTKARENRKKDIEKKKKRLKKLDDIAHFTYNPNGENKKKDSLNHSEVVKIGAYFLSKKDLMQRILINKYPILLVDESQDTNKELMEAFFIVQKKQHKEFSLGLFGDTMQRIYQDGKIDLGVNLPEDWEKPSKLINHRSPSRIVRFINQIRVVVDGKVQESRADKERGDVRLFVFHNNTNKSKAENYVKEAMVKITGDSLWGGSGSDVKALILEHHMAAKRLGFFDLFEPLYKIDSLKTGLLDGTLPGISLFTQVILPIIRANKNEDKFAIARIIMEKSPLIRENKDMKNQKSQMQSIYEARDAVERLLSLWKEEKEPTCTEILLCIADSKLFKIPDSLYHVAYKETKSIILEGEPMKTQEELNARDKELQAWSVALDVPTSQMETYDAYVNGQTNFTTHQGVKGLEFPRVMVVIDDKEARGFMFSYEKLFGVKGKTKSDSDNEKIGKETSIDRTRRLFYVICSRAKNSLVIVAYSENPNLVKEKVLSENWFEEDEIEVVAELQA
ncbi:MAG: UvrD-helicase domain-containing protein [Alkaliphilus sp.]